jgi:hypothetical protein
MRRENLSMDDALRVLAQEPPEREGESASSAIDFSLEN